MLRIFLSKGYFLLLSIYIFLIPQFSPEEGHEFNIIYDNLVYVLILVSILQIFYFFIFENAFTQLLSKRSFLWLYVFMLLSAISYFWSSVNDRSIQINHLIKIIFIITPLLLIKFRKNQISFLLKIYLFAAILGSLQIIYNYYFGSYSLGIRRSYITGIDSNESAIFIVIGFILTLYYYFRSKNIFYLIAGLPLIISVVFTGSRTGFFAILVSFIMALYFFDVIKFNLASIFVFVIPAIALFTLPYIVPNENLSRVMNITDDISNLNMSGREVIWSEMLRLIPERLLSGYGMNSTADVLEKYFARFNAHNVFLKALFELGLLGLFALILWIYYLIKKIFENKTAYRPLLLIITAIIIVSYMQLSWIYNIKLLVLISLILNISYNYHLENEVIEYVRT